MESQVYEEGINYYDFVEIKKYDYNSQEFTNMMKVNNFSLMLAHDFTIDSITNEYEFHGDALEFDYQIDFQTIQHLDRLYEKDDSWNFIIIWKTTK